MSASTSSGSRASSESASPPKRSASDVARSSVRFATNESSAPRLTRLRAASSPTLPAPMTTMRRPPRSPKTCAARAAAAEATDAGLSPIAVSVLTRLPVCSAWRKSRSRSGPTAPRS